MRSLAIVGLLVGCGRVAFDERGVETDAPPPDAPTCTPSPCPAVMLATAQGALRQILLDDTYIYYVAPQAVKRLAKTGGTPEVIAPYAGTGFRMTMRDNYLYWVTRDSGIVARAPTTPVQSAEMLATGQGDVGGIATDGNFVFWNTYPTAGRLLRKQIGSTDAAVDLIGPADKLTAMRLVGDSLYYLRQGVGLFRLPLGGTMPITIAPNVGSWELAIDGDDVFIANAALDGIVRVSIATGAVTEVATASGPWGIALDAKYVYYANEAGNTIARAPRTGGDEEILAQVVLPVGIAVDDTAVYWTTLNGELGKLQK